MDPFRKRLQKQFERSALHARKLNKNAMTLLHKQLLTLERRKQENARTIMRHKQALLEELNNTEEPEYVGVEDKEDEAHRPRGALQGLPKAVEHQSASSLSTSTTHKPSHFDSVALNHVEPKCTHSQSSTRGVLNSDLPLVYSRHCGGTKTTDKNSPEVCRFEALPPLNPCPYFPCRRPLHYHRLKVSDVPDIAPLRLDPEIGVLFSDSASSTTNLASSSSNKTTTSGSGSSDGPVSPRITINDRLRGLRQLVRELREKNDEKKPRDWTVNYGEPVSRRLLRKPLVPVSDEV